MHEETYQVSINFFDHIVDEYNDTIGLNAQSDMNA